MVSRNSSADAKVVSGPDDAPAYRSSLAALLGEAERPSRDVQVSDVTRDSRQAKPGSLFIACQGRTSHGVQHAAAAVERGAVAVLWEPAPGVEAPQLPQGVVVHDGGQTVLLAALGTGGAVERCRQQGLGPLDRAVDVSSALDGVGGSGRRHPSMEPRPSCTVRPHEPSQNYNARTMGRCIR